MEKKIKFVVSYESSLRARLTYCKISYYVIEKIMRTTLLTLIIMASLVNHNYAGLCVNVNLLASCNLNHHFAFYK